MLRVGLVAALVSVGALGAVVLGTAVRSPRPVGFQVTSARDRANRPFGVAVWYPTTSRPWPLTPLGSVLMNVARDGEVAGTSLPLVVISHGNGAGPASHVDLAMALASAGYVVAAPVHLGDNVTDQSALAHAAFFQDRVDQLSRTIDQLLHEWPRRDRIDTSRVAAYGFSAGGATVLGAVGARFELDRLASACRASSDSRREFVCGVLHAAGSPLVTGGADAVSTAFKPDPRVRVAILAAPGLAFLLDSASVADVRIPLQVWSGDEDDRVPTASNAERLRGLLPNRVEFHALAGAGHASFLAPCRLFRPAAFCRDADGFDREAVHARMNAAIVAFLRRHLGNATQH